MTDNQLPILADFYNGQAGDDNFTKYYKTAPFYSKATKFLTQVINGGIRVFDRVLDVGCGPGHLTAGLPGSVEVVGIDISPEMIKKAKHARPIGRYLVHDFHSPLGDRRAVRHRLRKRGF